MTSFLRTSLILAGTLSTAFAVNETGTRPPADLAGFHLKNRSTFTSPETTRPPFWPIGWNKTSGAPAPVEAAPVQETKIEADAFLVTSILLGNPSFAVINGRSYQQGEFLRASRPVKGGPAPATASASGLPANARVQVRKINDGSVVLVSGSQTFTVPLKRPSLNERKEEEILSSDR